MTRLPSGTLTFLCSDVEGSTRMWDLYSDQMVVALARHDDIVVECVRAHRGHIVKPARGGDSFLAVFVRAPDAIAAALALQRTLQREQWPAQTPIAVRVALHSGEAELRDDQYYGVAINRCARLMAIGHGGQTLLARSTYELVVGDLPADALLRPHGPHRLKDLQRAEEVFELCHPDLPDRFPPLRSLGALPNNLPLRLDNFVGRQAETEIIRKSFAHSRLVTLTGPGGIGKSRLALHLAAEEVEYHAGGTWWVDLAALARREDIPRAIAAVLGVRDEPSQPLLDALIRFIGDKNAFLVLDNAEHLRVGCASVVEVLSQRCSNLHALVTSREPLDLAGEMVWRVPPLSLDDSVDGVAPQDPTAADAVALFIDRARLARPDFCFSERAVATAVEICRQLDGMPLAIELAAARMGVLSPREILARLPDRFTLLAAARPTEARHTSLRAVIDLSFESLSEGEQRLFGRLSVLAADFSLDAAEHLEAGGAAAGGEVLDLLAGLVHKSMIVATENSAGQTRYCFSETLRLYGQERLADSGEVDEAHRAAAYYYADFLEAMEPELIRASNEAMQRIAAEHDNLRLVLRWAVGQSNATVALRISGVLGRFWYIRGLLREGIEWLQACLELDRDQSVALAIRARALRAAGTLAYALGDSTEAERYCQGSLESHRADGDQAGEARALNDLAILYHQSGQLIAARSLYQQSLEIKKARGDQHGVANTLLNLGLLAHWIGDLNEAEAAFAESLGHAHAAGEDRLIAKVALNLAVVALARGDHAAARARCEDSLQRHRALGDQAATALALVTLARIVRETGEVTSAMKLVDEGLAFADSIGYQWGVGLALEIRAKLHADAGRWDEASSDYMASKAVWEALGDRQNLANVFDGLGRMALARGNWREAARLHRECLVIRMDLDSPSPLMCCVCVEDTVGVLAVAGQPEQAARLAGAALAYRERSNVPLPTMAKRRMDEHLAAVRAALGEAGLATCLGAGRSTTLDKAVEQALDLTAEMGGTEEARTPNDGEMVSDPGNQHHHHWESRKETA